MKNILVPTDFSECSVNALNYAGELSKFTNAKIYFLHVYQAPIPATDVPLDVIEPSEEMEEEFRNEMNLIIAAQRKKHGWNADVLVLNGSGIVPFEINNVIKEKNIDLIVMGMRGRNNAMDRFFGSNATEMIKKAHCPLLLIPEQSSFHFPDRIAIAFDINHPADIKKLSVTKEFSRLFNSKLLAFTIINEKDDEVSEKAAAYAAVDTLLKDYEHSIHFNVHHDVQEGILSFIDEHKTKMLVMFHHTHNVFARIFSTINSKEISFDVKVPLLVVNEKANVYPPIAF